MSDMNKVLKKNIFRSALLLVLFSLVVFIGGCTLIPKGVRKDLMVDYLNDKYTDDHFEFIDYSGGKPWSNESVTILCSSEKFPDKTIKIRYVTKDNKYYDNDLGVKYAGQLDEYVDELAKELFPDYKTKHASYSENTTNAMLLDLPADTTFDDYLKNCNEVVYIYCEYDSNELEKHRNSIKNKAEETLPNKDMRFGVVDFNFTNSIDNGDVYSYLHISFDGTKNNEIKTIEWR